MNQSEEFLFVGSIFSNDLPSACVLEGKNENARLYDIQTSKMVTAEPNQEFYDEKSF